MVDSTWSGISTELGGRGNGCDSRFEREKLEWERERKIRKKYRKKSSPHKCYLRTWYKVPITVFKYLTLYRGEKDLPGKKVCFLAPNYWKVCEQENMRDNRLKENVDFGNQVDFERCKNQVVLLQA